MASAKRKPDVAAYLVALVAIAVIAHRRARGNNTASPVIRVGDAAPNDYTGRDDQGRNGFARPRRLRQRDYDGAASGLRPVRRNRRG